MTPTIYIFTIFFKNLFAVELQSVVFLANFYLMPPKIYDAGESRVCGITTALFPNKFIQVEKYVCHKYKNAFCTQNTYHTFKSIRNLSEGRFEVQKLHLKARQAKQCNQNSVTSLCTGWQTTLFEEGFRFSKKNAQFKMQTVKYLERGKKTEYSRKNINLKT